MVQSPTWEANQFSASQEIPRILFNPNVHCRIHKCPPPVLILNNIDLAHSFTSHLLKIHRNIILPSMAGPSKWSLSLRSPHQNPINTSTSPIRATCPAHLILLDLMAQTLLGEVYRALRSLCSFLHSFVLSSLLGPNILLSTLFSNILSLSSSPQCRRWSWTPVQSNRQNCNSVCLNFRIFR